MVSATLGGNTDDVSGNGDSLTFVVGYSAGSVFDTYTRLVAPRMSRHLAGRPKIFVENRVGGGGVVAADHLYKVAKPDGRTIGNWSGDLVLKQIFGSEQVNFDVRRFNWVGAVATTHPVCVLTKASGVNGLEDWSQAPRPVRLGGIGQNGTTPKTARVLAAALGLPIKLVDGYQGTVKVRLAAEARELDGGCWHWQSIKKGWAKMLKTGDARIVLQAMTRVHPDLPGVPNAIEFAKSSEAKLLITHGIHDPATIARFYSLPPGTPKEKVDAIREAFSKTVQDPLFLAETRSLGLEVNPVDGAHVEQTVTGLFALEPKLKVKLRKLLFPEKPRPDAKGGVRGER
jgi:tripartite-type tricarboxylate transporter receptor subunit TctC